MTTPWARLGLALVLLAALFARLGVVSPRLGSAPEDPDRYIPLARSLAAGEGFRLPDRFTAYRPPLYPLTIAPVVAMAGDRPGDAILLSQILIGLATTALTWQVARRWGLGPGASHLAALFVALDPVLIAQSRVVMTETLAALLVVLTLLAVTARPLWKGCLLGGLAFGLASLCRPSLLPTAGLAAVAAILFAQGTSRQRLTGAAILTMGVVVVLSPWAIRNARLLGEPVWTTTHGGYTLFLANNDLYYDDVVGGRMGSAWTGPNQERWFGGIGKLTRGRPEPAADRLLRDAAIRTIRARPLDFLRASLARLGRLWGLAPSASVYPPPIRIACAIWTLPLWLLLAGGLTRRTSWTWPRVVAIAFLVGLTCIHAVFWTDLRMRAPVVPAIALLAASALPVSRQPLGESIDPDGPA